MKLHMLQVARLAPNLLRDSAPLVVDFLQSQLHPAGGFVDREGKPDLYYTVFGVQCLRALRVEPPADALGGYLRSFGEGQELDLIHLTCLARCWSDLTTGKSRSEAVPAPVRRAVLDRLSLHRAADGGYSTRDGEAGGSAYGCFLAVGAMQDLDHPPPDPEGISRCLAGLARGDGSYSNDADITLGNTPATAAAVSLLHQLRQPTDSKSSDWLLSVLHPDGGFFALPGAPMPDLLSTAVALHALSCLHPATRGPLDALRDKCLDFIDTLWTNRGSFYGNWAEQTLDVEYTWYALLALGHLAV
jgi:hypothetical protein